MSERRASGLLWLIAVISFIWAATCMTMNLNQSSVIRDLQRRVSQLEQQVKR